MGVLKTPFGFWSDSGHDLVDDFLQKRYPKARATGFDFKFENMTRKQKRFLLGAYRAALDDKKFRKKFNAVHLKTTGKTASANEFKHHVATGLGLSHTGLFGRPKLPGFRRRPDVRVRPHRRRA